MYYLYGENYQEIQSIIESSFFNQLVAYLLNNESIILRDLKKQFADESLFDKKLEKLIEAGLVVRQNRRYTFGGKILTDYYELPEVIKNASLTPQFLMQLASKMKKIAAGEFYLLNSEQVVWFQTFQTPYFSWHILYNHPEQTNIATYFNACATQNHLENHRQMYALLGDVDVNYYLDQIEVLIEKIKKGRRRIRHSIFVESAEQFGLIEKFEDRLIIRSDVLIEEDVPVAKEDAILLAAFDSLTAIEQRQVLNSLMQQLHMECLQQIK